MRKIKFRKVRKIQPNALEYTGKHKQFESQMQLFIYDDSYFKEYPDFTLEDLKKITPSKNNWLNLHGLNNIELIQGIGSFFQIDHFILSDILNTSRRTKLEQLPSVLFFNIKSLLPTEQSDSINVEQISFILKEGILISFQEKRSDFFTHIRERIRTKTGNVRSEKTDYLLYLLLDAVMENFYITIENEEDKVEALIAQSKTSSNPEILVSIEKHRDNFNFLKRSIVPLRDSLLAIKSLKNETSFLIIEPDTYNYFTRLYQKSLELLEQIESDMGILESASNFFFSSQAHKMNEIMKTLTVISAIFIPLTFIVGVYGMNFENMPELKYHDGYYIVIGFMVVIGLLMIYYFKKRKWF
ncbi:magnesium/cobalt transporter CorA [Flavobacterium sp. UMI-01]|uniref:magnesium/cobalt transporter CorA n=1 Tax=Flavobacterium sp. UMI-01 TaxID=1441053 RepID=UPI001C7CC3EC|nr:magnesium/cobalt transporter CorA [Flavobacterium sp. UMI-01]GIZ08649.1 magnesium transport protein CorA [Flavobacterium sp. UMI-01]